MPSLRGVVEFAMPVLSFCDGNRARRCDQARSKLVWQRRVFPPQSLWHATAHTVLHSAVFINISGLCLHRNCFQPAKFWSGLANTCCSRGRQRCLHQGDARYGRQYEAASAVPPGTETRYLFPCKFCVVHSGPGPRGASSRGQKQSILGLAPA